MKICCCWLYAISKYGYPPSIKDTFKVIREMANLGFKFIELEGVGEKNLMDVYRNRKELKKICNDLGIKVINFCPILPDSINIDKEKRKKAKELFKIGLDIANFFESKTVQIDTFTPPLKFIGETPYKEAIKFGKQFKVKVDPEFSWDKQWEIIVETVNEYAELAKKRNLGLLIEPRVGENISNTDALLRLMEHCKNENIGAVLDTGHLNAQKEILVLSIEKLKDKIKYLHVSDNDGKTNAHLPLGKGTIDWEGVFLALKKHKFDGYVGVDIGHVPNLDKAYRDAIKFLNNISKNLKI